MRYFLLILLLLAASVVGIAGFRGQMSRKPPLEVFDDMKRQPKLRPQKPFAFFEDARSSRLQVPGTIARGQRFEDLPVNTGCVTGTTNYVAANPVPVTSELLARGKERFTIFCAPCHSAVGDGNGITSKYGMIRAGNFHDPRIVRLSDGEIFNIVTKGKNLMPSYASQVPVQDRWAIIACIRALQRARVGTADDVPAAQKGNLKP